jgi:hypothetical protein
MKKLRYYIVFLFFSAGLIYFNGCNPTSSTSYTGHLKGTVRDSSTHEFLENAHFHSIPSLRDTVSGFYGNYSLDIPMGNSTQTVTIIISRNGYIGDTLIIELKSDETKQVNIALLPGNGIFFSDGLVLDQYVNNLSFCAVNLTDFIVKQDGIFDVDARFRNDSNLVYLKTGYIETYQWGYQTSFSPFLGTYTKNEFDTLAKYYGASNPVNPDADFPNTTTLKSPYREVKNNVFAFYLKGRFIPGNLKIYGLVHIDSVWKNSGSGLFKMMIDVKINTLEKNYFIH